MLISSHFLHGYNPEMILLSTPHQERLVIIVEDAPSCWPVLNGIGCLEETVSLLEEVVVVDQLLLGRRVHAAKGVILP